MAYRNNIFLPSSVTIIHGIPNISLKYCIVRILPKAKVNAMKMFTTATNPIGFDLMCPRSPLTAPRMERLII